MRAALPIAAIAAALAVALFWRDGESLKPGVAEMKAAHADEGRAAQRGGVSAAVRSAPAVRAASVVPAPAVQRSTLSADMRQLRERRNFKDLYERLSALPNPTPEQQYILAQIMLPCSANAQKQLALSMKSIPEGGRDQFVASLSAKDPNREQRIAAYDNVKSGNPCEGLQLATTPGSAGIVDEYMQALRRARAGDWSYFTLVNGPSTASLAQRRR